MNPEFSITKRQILIVVLLLIGVIASVYLATQPQILKSRADMDVYSTLDIKDAVTNQTVTCNGAACTTDAQTVKIELKGHPNDLFKR